jgi:hypothetical protein
MCASAKPPTPTDTQSVGPPKSPPLPSYDGCRESLVGVWWWIPLFRWYMSHATIQPMNVVSTLRTHGSSSKE